MCGKHDDIQKIRVKAEDDSNGKIEIDGLKADTEYRYQVWFGADEHGRKSHEAGVTGSFRTAPAARKEKPVTFAWGGDLFARRYQRRLVTVRACALGITKFTELSQSFRVALCHD